MTAIWVVAAGAAVLDFVTIDEVVVGTRDLSEVFCVVVGFEPVAALLALGGS